MPSIHHDASLLTEEDLYLFNEGSHFRLFEKLGSHLYCRQGVAGSYFAVWAPNADAVSVVGDFNGWSRATHPLHPRGSSGIWEGWIERLGRGTVYKYAIHPRDTERWLEKADPFAFCHETPPRTASNVWDLDFSWTDGDWMAERGARSSHRSPVSIYEVHLGSWRRVPEEGNRSLTYREIAPMLAEHVARLGFTHVELLPVMEHPFYGSWGYQCAGYFAPTARYGTPQDLMFLIDHLHRRGIGVILDWVPSHFPADGHGLAFFDGTHLYEHADPRQGFHPDWRSSIFNYGRHEVRSFLASSALFWLERYHADALRVDAVASMLYLDYARQDGEWIPNAHGGRENLEAIGFLRWLNASLYAALPDIQSIAEESTAWPAVSRPTHVGGLGFGYKWDMGWMHDTLGYMRRDPIHRRYHHHDMSVRMLYAFHESFVLPLSHDEVVHGKGSLLARMPGDEWQRFANLRLLYGWMYAQPGKKLLFMGAEFGQSSEWSHETSLDWHLLGYPVHQGVERWIADLNASYRREKALHERDCEASGFEWIDANDADGSTFSFLRIPEGQEAPVLAVFNFTPVPRYGHRIGVPRAGRWVEILNSDALAYGGSGLGNSGGADAEDLSWHGRPASLRLTLPPLGMLLLKPESRAGTS